MNADKLTRDYRCAACWGALVLKYFEGEREPWRVVCAKDASHAGFVTAHFVNMRRLLNTLEAAEVGSAFAAILHLPRPDLKAARRALYGEEE